MQFKEPPYPHQLECFDATKTRESYAIFWEMGCVDGETEYLAPDGWHPISEYVEGRVAQFDTRTGLATFVTPVRYVQNEDSEFVHLKNSRGLDQMLTLDHRVLYLDKKERWRECRAEKLLDLGPRAWRYLPATFRLESGPPTGLSENTLRLQIAAMADGSWSDNSPDSRRVTIRLKKRRKIDRLDGLLSAGNTPNVNRRKGANGYTLFSFDTAFRGREFPWMWVSSGDRQVILDEVFHWDGWAGKHPRGPAFYSNLKSSVDFVQLQHAASGGMASVGEDKREGRSTNYRTNLRGVRHKHLVLTGSNVHRAPNQPSYCFQVPSGALVLRRNGNIFITGNCGKTKTALDIAAWQYIHGYIDTLFVVAPKGVHRNWITDEVPEHLSPDVDKHHAVWYQGSRMKGVKYKAEMAKAVEFDGLLIVAMNYDAVITKAGRAYADRIMDERKVMMVLDESPRIKNPNAKRTKAVFKLGDRAVSRRILTGTPITNGPFDAYAQIRFLDAGFWPSRHFGTYSAFKNHYGIYNVQYLSEGRRFNALVGYKNVDSLYDILSPISDRKTKETVLDLPPKIYTKRYIEPTKEQARLYTQLRDEALTFLSSGEMVTAQIVLVELLRLQQIISGFVTTEMEQEIRDIEGGNPRIDGVVEVLEECAPQQTIIWARFKHDIDLISKRLTEEEITHVTYDGRTSDKDRAEAIDKFRSGEARVFLANPAAAGEGLTLIEATVVLNYSHSFKLAERLQSEDRAHRIGQEKPVLYVDFICPGTIDEKIVGALRRKLNIASVINGDTYREWI